MKIGFIILFTFCVWIVIAEPLTDKNLHGELKKMLKNKQYVLELVDGYDSNAIKGKYYHLKTNAEDAGISYIYLGRVNTMRSQHQQTNGNSSEYFDYFILYDKQLAIQKVKIFNYQASHGEMISSPGWLKSFQGYTPKKSLEIGKQVDAISGATISVNKLTFDIKQKSNLLYQLVVGK